MDIKETIFDLIDDHINGVDIYNHNGSIWLIFTDSKKWVIELTKEKTLWYNYYFFNNIFKYLSLDVINNQDYITEWVKDTIQNGVGYTYSSSRNDALFVKDTIQNGVRYTPAHAPSNKALVEDDIQNGVQHTQVWDSPRRIFVEDAIQNGVKYTDYDHCEWETEVEDIIQNGVKVTISEPSQRTWKTENVIKDSIVEIKPHYKQIINPMNFESNIQELERLNEVNKIIQNSVKEIKELPDQSGELRGYGYYYAKQEDRTKPHIEYVNDVINGKGS